MSQTQTASTQALLASLGDKRHLERERALKALLLRLKTEEDASQQDKCSLAAILEGIKHLTRAPKWECRLGGLLGAKAIIQSHTEREFDDEMLTTCLGLLEDEEVRVRMNVGEVLQALARKYGLRVFEASKPVVLESITQNFDREGEGSKRSDPLASGPSSPSLSPSSSSGDLISCLLESSYKVVRPGEGDMRHGSEGWRSLETSMRALQHLVEGAGCEGAECVDEGVMQLLLRAAHHPNRFVRETSHLILGSISTVLPIPRLLQLAPEIAARLADGLTDSWSQVRLSACMAVRSFLQSLQCSENQQLVFGTLLPPLCLNRHYVAEGVKVAAQETWRRVMGPAGGKEVVAQHIKQFVNYYIAQSKASNHAVREAACACIAELADKIDPAAVSPHVPALLRALLLCFKDSSWPVRDAACIACGRCVLAFPSECRFMYSELMALWTDHLWDNTPTVREHGASALADAIRAYGDEAKQAAISAIKHLLPKVHEEPPDLPNGGSEENSDTHNDPAQHSDKEMFSCEPVISRFSMNYAVKSDGCMDFGSSRPRRPWEATDGAIYMIRELSAVAPDAIDQFIPELADALRVNSFQQAFNLHETMWRCWPAIATNIGKSRVKRYLELFLPVMFDDVVCGHQLTETAAAKCVLAMQSLLGAKILEGRLDERQLQILRTSPLLRC